MQKAYPEQAPHTGASISDPRMTYSMFDVGAFPLCTLTNTLIGASAGSGHTTTSKLPAPAVTTASSAQHPPGMFVRVTACSGLFAGQSRPISITRASMGVFDVF